MEENIDKRLDLKEKVNNLYQKNKIKILSIISIIILAIFLVIFLGINKKKNNMLVSEKYIEAGIHLSENQNEKAKIILKEIIYEKNDFYSVLALNTILEKNLEDNKNEILNFFNEIEKLKLSNEQKDIVKFKKALYLLKIAELKEANNLLKQLVDTNSNLKKLAKEILTK